MLPPHSHPHLTATHPPLLDRPAPVQVRPSKTSKAFWEAMAKVQNHLTDAKKIQAYNQKKEQKMRVRGRGWWVAEFALGRLCSRCRAGGHCITWPLPTCLFLLSCLLPGLLLLPAHRLGVHQRHLCGRRHHPVQLHLGDVRHDGERDGSECSQGTQG